MMDLETRIFDKIRKFSIKNGNFQKKILLPSKSFDELLLKANSTELGRSFTKYGLKFCDLFVYPHNGKEIIIK
jgi:hypothetical protein